MSTQVPWRNKFNELTELKDKSKQTRTFYLISLSLYFSVPHECLRSGWILFDYSQQ